MFILVLMSIPITAEAKNVTLSWDPSPTETVVGYTLYWSNDPLIPINNRVKVPVGDVLTFYVANLSDDKEHYFTVTAQDDNSNESAYSNIVYSKAIEPEPLPDLEFDIEWQLMMQGK